MSYEKFGSEVRDFLRGFLGVEAGGAPAPGTPHPGPGQPPQVTPYQPGQTDITPSGIGLEANQAAELKPGDILIVFDEKCWQVDPKTGAITIVFRLHRQGHLTFWTAVPRADGYIYCTASGYMSPTEPIQYATFGYRGAVLRVNHKNRELISVSELVDPVGVEFLDDSRMLIADFNNWETTGQIYIVDRGTGKAEKIADGGLITEPYRAHLDAEGVLWVANASGLTYEGEIIRVDTDGKQKIVVPRRGPYSGVICTVFPSNNPEEILGINVDWPGMASSSLFSVNKRTNNVEVLLSTSASRPGVYSPHIAIDNDVVWLTESYNNELLAFDLKTRKIVERIDISVITGPYVGVLHAWDFAESVTIVPAGFGGYGNSRRETQG